MSEQGSAMREERLHTTELREQIQRLRQMTIGASSASTSRSSARRAASITSSCFGGSPGLFNSLNPRLFPHPAFTYLFGQNALRFCLGTLGILCFWLS